MVKLAWLAADHAATHRSSSPPACPEMLSGPERGALAAWMPQRGCSARSGACPKSPIPPPLTLQELLDVVVPHHLEGGRLPSAFATTLAKRGAAGGGGSDALSGGGGSDALSGGGGSDALSGGSSSGGSGGGSGGGGSGSGGGDGGGGVRGGEATGDIGNFELLYDEAVELEAEKMKRDAEVRRKATTYVKKLGPPRLGQNGAEQASPAP